MRTEVKYEREKTTRINAQLQAQNKELLQVMDELHTQQSRAAQAKAALNLKTTSETQLMEELQQLRGACKQLEADLTQAGQEIASLTNQVKDAKLQEQKSLSHMHARDIDLARLEFKYEESKRVQESLQQESQGAQQEIQAERQESTKLKYLIEDLTTVLAEKEDELAAAVDALGQVATRLQAADVEASAARAVCTRAQATACVSASCPVTPRFITYHQRNSNLLLASIHAGNLTSTVQMAESLHGHSTMQEAPCSRANGWHQPVTAHQETLQSISNRQDGPLFKRASGDGISAIHKSSCMIRSEGCKLGDNDQEEAFTPRSRLHQERRCDLPLSSPSQFGKTHSLPEGVVPRPTSFSCGREQQSDIPQSADAGKKEEGASNASDVTLRSSVSLASGRRKYSLTAKPDMAEPEVPKLDLHAVQSRNSALIRTKRAELMNPQQSRIDTGRKKFRTSSFALPSRVSRVL